MKNIIFLVPFFNEEKNLKTLSDLIKKTSINRNFTYKILFLDDCSTDNSFQIISEFKSKNMNDDLIIYQNTQNLGHGKSLLRLYDLTKDYIDKADSIVTFDSDMKIEYNEFNDIFENDNSVICKRKRFEEGLFRMLITLSAEFIIFLKTGKFWRDGNCPFRLYKKEDFLLIKSLIPENILTPNILSTIIFIKRKIPHDRKKINLIYDNKNSGVTWKGVNPFSKYINILNFSLKSSLEILKLKI
jgi:glycosyltransferase involved in cell wall biosynthesis